MIPSVLNGPDLSPASLGRDQQSGRHTHPERSVDFDNTHLKSRSLPFQFSHQQVGSNSRTTSARWRPTPACFYGYNRRWPQLCCRRLSCTTDSFLWDPSSQLTLVHSFRSFGRRTAAVAFASGDFVGSDYGSRLLLIAAIGATPKRFSLAVLFVKAHARTAKGRPGYLPVCKRPARQ